MYSGYLDKRVTVSQVQKVFDGRGGFTQKETPLGVFWAAMLPITLVEQTQYQALDTDVSLKVYMRYDRRFQKGMYLTFRGKKYQIQGVINPAFQDEFMQVVVSEV